MEKDQNTIEFVKHRLGCGCPYEVFEQIEYGETGRSQGPYARTITLGGRLLIHIWEVNDLSLLKNRLPALLARGLDERDRRGLNRFRAVLATDDVGAMKALAEKLFDEFGGKDEKIHLHVVHIGEVAGLMGEGRFAPADGL